jgi:hypothetical protein
MPVAKLEKDICNISSDSADIHSIYFKNDIDVSFLEKINLEYFQTMSKSTSTDKKIAGIYKFNQHFENWKKNPSDEKQWSYDLSRDKREGRLSKEKIELLESQPLWKWSDRKKKTIIPVNEVVENE